MLSQDLGPGWAALPGGTTPRPEVSLLRCPSSESGLISGSGVCHSNCRPETCTEPRRRLLSPDPWFPPGGRNPELGRHWCPDPPQRLRFHRPCASAWEPALSQVRHLLSTRPPPPTPTPARGHFAPSPGSDTLVSPAGEGRPPSLATLQRWLDNLLPSRQSPPGRKACGW